MAEVSAEMVKELRAKTGAGMMDCKSALAEAGGDMSAAIEVLRKRGLKDIGKRAGKVAAEGVIGHYVHPGGQIVAVVELNCETDFVARNDEFQALARDIAMHIAAMKPLYVTEESVPAQILDKEKEIFMAQMDEKQRAKADKILPGKIDKFYEDVVLYRQAFIKDDSGSRTVKNIVEELSMKVGEKVVVRRFERFEVGEGVEKVQANLAAEVAAMTA